MGLQKRHLNGLSCVFDEATLVACEVDRARQIVGLTVAVLQAPREEEVPVLVAFGGVTRVVAHREGGSHESSADPRALDDWCSRLRAAARLPGDHAMAGLDVIDYDLTRAPVTWWWEKRDVDIDLGDPIPETHTFYGWHEGEETYDVVVWFDSVRLFAGDGSELSIDELVAASDDWWQSPKLGSWRRAADTSSFEAIPLSACWPQ